MLITNVSHPWVLWSILVSSHPCTKIKAAMVSNQEFYEMIISLTSFLFPETSFSLLDPDFQPASTFLGKRPVIGKKLDIYQYSFSLCILIGYGIRIHSDLLWIELSGQETNEIFIIQSNCQFCLPCRETICILSASDLDMNGT